MAVRTQSVDVTITNLLEGVIAYDAIPPPQPKTHTPSPFPSLTHSLKSCDLRPRKYYSPAMEAMQRQLSLDERKKLLLESARRYEPPPCALRCNIRGLFPSQAVYREAWTECEHMTVFISYIFRCVRSHWCNA